MSRAAINPAILKWALDRVSIEPAQLAQRLGVKEDLIHLWLAGDEQPTFRQAEDVASALRISFGYLFLSKPPQTVSPTPDFRTLPEGQSKTFSPELEDTINDAKRKQDWLREWRIQEGGQPLSFIGRFSIKDSVKQIAQDIRINLKLVDLPDTDIKNSGEQLRFLVRQAEEAGILVLQSGVALGNSHRPLSLDEFRGFNLVDSYAPVIFINSRDADVGRIFTLAHELAHLWSGKPGVSNPSFRSFIGNPEVERFCNHVAAEVLVPSSVFLSQWKIQFGDDILQTVKHLAVKFRVSNMVILIRARELELIDQAKYNYLDSELKHPYKPRNYSKPGGNSFFNIRARNGRILLQEISAGLRQGSIMYRDAANLLNVHPRLLDGIMSKV